MADRKAFDPTEAHAFLSYTRADDDYLDGGITWLRGALERAVRAQTGSPFQIFQDVEDIEHGDNWELKLAKALESAQLIVPILTPSFFTSEFCRREANSFLDYEAEAGRNDLILPIYLINADTLEDTEARAEDALATRLHQRQFDDWRELRLKLRDPATRPKIENLATTLARAVKRRIKASVKPSTTKLKTEPQKPTTEGRLSALEAAVTERDQALEVERTKREQAEAELADERARPKELAEMPVDFRGKIEEAKQREEDLLNQIEYLRQQSAKAGALLKEEQARSEKIERAPMSVPRFWLFGGVALGLLVGIGSWMAGQEMVSPATLEAELTAEIDNLSQRLNASEHQVAQRESELSETREQLRAVNEALEAAKLQPSTPVSPDEPFKDCEDCPEMVALPTGKFLMGSPDTEKGRFHWEGPQREVTVQPFAICTHEVTFDQWDACVAAEVCDHSPGDRGWGRGGRPVINVSWNDAQQYLGWLSEKTGRSYRLPSEAEWEYAARAGTMTRYFWGDEVGENRANCEDCGSQWDNQQTALVGSFKANGIGLFDMHGNVYEWVEDRWHYSYTGAPDDGTPWVNSDSASRVVRGGSWISLARGVRSAFRRSSAPSNRVGFLGFRCARVWEPAGG